MGLFNWLQKLFGNPAPPRVPPVMPAPGAPPVIASQNAAPSAPPVPPVRPAAAKVTGPRKLNLDPGQFAPLSQDEVKKQAKGLGAAWNNPWFGRRDLIPPVSDPRTALINRAMVGLGLITPEQLTEIHKVGEQMDQVRPDLALASQMAEAAVARSQEEKEALKKQKKAEAAARKERHAQEVARRKETDIFFLGRGVSGGLSDRRANVEKLQRMQLPVLATPADLAQAFGISIPRLRWLAFHSEAATVSHYVRFQVPKKSGGVRELAAPHYELACCQEWILINILEKIPIHPAAHGFVPGRSTMSNAVPHVGQSVLVNADLKDFFPSITFPRVKGILQQLGFSPAVATILALLCTECPRRKVKYDGREYHVATGPRSLPQGACTSPAISNLIAYKIDVRLAGLAKKLGWNYTRYADDLTFSTKGEPARFSGYVMARLRHIAEEEHFAVNEKKTRVQRPNTAQTVTGIVVNQRPNIPRQTRRRLRAILHRAQKEGLAAQNRNNLPHFEYWLGGMIAYVHMVNPYLGKKLRAKFDALQG